MSKKGPILIIDDDPEDHEILKEIFADLSVSNKLQFFINSDEALLYLKTTPDQPFLILSDINMPKTNGIELRKKITENEELRRKCIPFIFLTTGAANNTVSTAYEMSVQGFFQKGTHVQEIKSILRLIIDYWTVCLHPNCSSLE